MSWSPPMRPNQHAGAVPSRPGGRMGALCHCLAATWEPSVAASPVRGSGSTAVGRASGRCSAAAPAADDRRPAAGLAPVATSRSMSSLLHLPLSTSGYRMKKSHQCMTGGARLEVKGFSKVTAAQLNIVSCIP
jgi:hypothetical protein